MLAYFSDLKLYREDPCLWYDILMKFIETPFGALPVLEIDGRAVAQSNAVARYLARKYGLAGKDEWEELECDVLVDTLQDLKQGNTYTVVING